jgi:hypothetical protein
MSTKTEEIPEETTGSDSKAVLPSDENPDPQLFYELVSLQKFRHYNIVKPGPVATPAYHITNCETLRRKKFDLTVHQGSPDGQVFGVAKRQMRGWTVGFGSPADEFQGKELVWEQLQRPKKFSHKVYYFEFGSGADRKTYTYRKTYGTLKRLKSMELRAGGVDDEDGELLAKWVGNNGWTMKTGSLFIKRLDEKGQDQEVWERAVCLTAFAIIESQIRRSKG